jgi:hypothetical protein
MFGSIAMRMESRFKPWTGTCELFQFFVHPILSSHVALVAMLLKESAFNLYRCDRSVSLGVNIDSIVKVRTCGYAYGLHACVGFQDMW